MSERQLVLVRHAKTADGTPDILRQLAPQGRVHAAAIGKWLAEYGVLPDRVVVSPAKRAQETWQLLAPALNAEPRVVTDDRIYDNNAHNLLEIARETDDPFNTLMLIGHNPSMQELAVLLDDSTGDAAAREFVTGKFPTSATALFAVSEWADLRAHAATLLAAAAPRG